MAHDCDRTRGFAGGGHRADSLGAPDLLSRKSTIDDDDEIDLVLAAVNPGYVGATTCAECHAQRVGEFQKTRHFLACTPASGMNAAGFAPGRGSHPTRDPSIHYEMTRSGDAFLATGVQSTPQGENRVSHQIELVYGAGGSGDEMYFAWQGDRLYNLPIGWLNPFQRWGHTIDSVEARVASPSCLECHNTWVAHVPGTPNQYRRDEMILGVTCERCHGPGQDHVAHHRMHPKDRAAAIVHPGTLPRERLMEVCVQCHGNLKRRGPLFSYRPGEPLEASFRVVQTKHPEDDQVANQVQYLRRSKCFQKSEMTCVTCHNPHRPAQPATTQRACMKCHTAASCKDQPRLPEAVRGDCVGCHMPARVWMNVRFHTTDDQYVPVASRSDHRIAVHPEGKQAVLLAWLRKQTDVSSRNEANRLAALLANHWLNEADQRRRDHRLLATIGALREALNADPNPKTRQLLQEAIARQSEFDRLVTATNHVGHLQPSETIELLQKVLAIKPDYAPVHGELGMLYARMGNRDAAKEQLRTAARYDPEDTFSISTLAQLAYLEGRWGEAAALYAKADEIDPYDANIHHGWGMTLVKDERWADAEVHFQRALTINPRHAGTSASLSELLRHQGHFKEAVLHARRAVHWTESRNAKMLLTLADAYVAAKRPTDARKTLEQALQVAEESNPGLVEAIRGRLRETR